MSTQKHTHKQKLDDDIFLYGQGNKVTLIKNRNRTYAKKIVRPSKNNVQEEKKKWSKRFVTT